MPGSLNPVAEFARWTTPSTLDGVETLHARFWSHRFAPHMHDTWAISAVVHGAKDNVVGSAPNVARAGQIVVLRPHQVHGGRVVGNEPCEYVMAYVPARLLIELAQQAGMADASLPGHALDDAELVQRFATLVRGETLPLPVLRRQGRTAEAPWDRLLTDLLKRYNDCARRSDARCEGNGNRQQMKDALAYLHTHWDESVSLATLSEQAGMSQAHFCRSFAKVYGLPPHRYQTVLRPRASNRCWRRGRAFPMRPSWRALRTKVISAGNSRHATARRQAKSPVQGDPARTQALRGRQARNRCHGRSSYLISRIIWRQIPSPA